VHTAPPPQHPFGSPPPPLDEVTLRHALDVAIAVALEAGAKLRTEFESTAGPRGQGDHADADHEAEIIIRTRLAEHFPDDSFLGEESGRAPSDVLSRRAWVVDPNDGTHSYLAGHRGPAVSIALLDCGEPVVGVVYAHSAPDSDGDLIAGAVGLGVWRNGQPVPPLSDPPEPAWDTVVLTPLATLGWSAASVVWLAPARFRALPSVAYRLALAAAGDGHVAISRGSLYSWDVAAGHALLLAAGANLTDIHGQAPVYALTGEGTLDGVVGGPARLREAIRKRPWPRPRGDSSVFPAINFAAPPRPRPSTHASQLSRAHGALLGQLIGDALGGLVEFQQEEQIAAKYPGGPRDLINGGHWGTLAGQPTDDSEMALALARSIAASGGYSRDAAFAAYVAWAESGPYDMGNATHAALRQKRPDPTSQANGALMRSSPLGIAGARMHPDELASAARLDAAITHPDQACLDANVVFTAAIAHAIRTGEGPSAVYEHALDLAMAPSMHPLVRSTVQSARSAPPERFYPQMGWFKIAFQNAFYVLVNADGPEAAIRMTIARGGDTDTNAAIAGALVGAVYGRQALPHRWRQMVLTCRPVRLPPPAPAHPRITHPRPEQFWPVDALELAETLLTTGL
jgi:ADP-ribosyl-[dinitrogen reductase] hydrolase